MMKNGGYADFKIFTGNSNFELAEQIAEIMGKQLGKSTVSKFSDNEISPWLPVWTPWTCSAPP